MSSKRCRIRFRSGDLISAVDGVTCDDEASAAKKTRPDNQGLDVTVWARLKRQQSAGNNIEFARKNRDPLDTNNDFTPPRHHSGGGATCRKSR
jgi:hypothetical protein